jgi:hypothetical protein
MERSYKWETKRIDKVVLADRIVPILTTGTDRIGHGPNFDTVKTRRLDHRHQDD